jgi:hypothetical protein
MSYTDPRLLLQRLTERDRAVLDDIEKFRLLSTRLVQRLHFPIGTSAHVTASAATKATMRVLTRLNDHGVIGHLERRIGGVRHGSQGYIWQLTSTGATIQRTRRGETGRRRYTEPSALFSDHTLAVAELAVTIRELAAAGHLDVLALQTEPDCWRDYVGPHGLMQTIKPDLYSVTAAGEFEDHLFLEADQGSEHLPQVLAKCRAYAAYHATGAEQHRSGVFPLVLWITPSRARALQLRRAIASDANLPSDLFQVITTDQFADHLTITAEDTS